MTGTTVAPGVTVVRPALRRAPFADVLTAWLHAGIAARADGHERAGPTRPVVVIVIVPEYLHAAPPALLADLATGAWAGHVVGLVGYAGRTRARHALDDARDALRNTGATLVGPSLGIDAARVRAVGFDAADVVLRDLVLDGLTAA